ncbi:MAG: hypothetical protein IPI80_21000 [Burkholderiales bacterium]|nr:hypothetical protein [Burkholderiales bacterium]
MASKTIEATSAAVTSPEVTALVLVACATIWLTVGLVSLRNSLGRFKCELWMLVGTKYGHSTEQ